MLHGRRNWGCMADSLDPIAVRIQHKRCKVVRMVLGAQAGFTTALTTANKRGSVKRSHCLAIRSTETYMHTATGHRIASFHVIVNSTPREPAMAP